MSRHGFLETEVIPGGHLPQRADAGQELTLGCRLEDAGLVQLVVVCRCHRLELLLVVLGSKKELLGFQFIEVGVVSKGPELDCAVANVSVSN